jgi:triphosphatase
MDDPRAAVHSISRRNLGPAKPVKASAPYVARTMHPQDAFRITLSDCLSQIAANAAALRAGRSVEGLHQLRVALRRLDVALGAFGREFHQDWLEELRSRGKILSGRLGPARDLDVFVGKLLDGAPQTSGDGIAGLRARAQSARDAAWEGVRACIASTDFELFTADVAALAQSHVPLTHQRKLGKAANRMLARQMKQVKKRGKVAASREEGDLHRLRIALKKLRYIAEFFAPLYPRKDVKAYLGKLRGLQTDLGELNDIANVKDVVASLMKGGGNEPSACFTAGAVSGWYGAQTPHAIKRAVRRYRKFRKVEPFWQ